MFGIFISFRKEKENIIKVGKTLPFVPDTDNQVAALWLHFGMLYIYLNYNTRRKFMRTYPNSQLDRKYKVLKKLYENLK